LPYYDSFSHKNVAYSNRIGAKTVGMHALLIEEKKDAQKIPAIAGESGVFKRSSSS
jgi:hypothetical protein